MLGYKFSNNERIYFSSILSGVLSSFHDTARFLDSEQIRITNNPHAKTPIYYSRTNNNLPFDLVVLNCSGFSYWCQVIYQLSHELAHCTISHMNEGCYTCSTSWIEETICEATSLYSLRWFSENWDSVFLSKLTPAYSKNIETYLVDILTKKGTNRLSNCKSIYELEEINRTSAEMREDRRNEMKWLYTLLGGNGLFALFSYRKFIMPGTIILDTVSYSSAFQSIDAVQYLCSLQDRILLRS